MTSIESGQAPGGLEPPRTSSRPLPVTVAFILLMANFLFDLIYCFWDGFRTYLPFPPPGTNILFALFMLWPLALILFIIAVLYFPLWFVYRRKNWARWYGVFLTGLILIGFINANAAWFPTITLLVNVIAMVALFLPASNQWFRKRPKNG